MTECVTELIDPEILFNTCKLFKIQRIGKIFFSPQFLLLLRLLLYLSFLLTAPLLIQLSVFPSLSRFPVTSLFDSTDLLHSVLCVVWCVRCFVNDMLQASVMTTVVVRSPQGIKVWFSKPGTYLYGFICFTLHT